MRKTLLIALGLLSILSCQKKEKEKTEVSYLDFDKATFFYEKSQYDSAYVYFNRAISLNSDSVFIGKALFNMATIESIQGDFYGSNETSVKSINFFAKLDTSYLASVYNTIAINNSELKEYNEAIRWFKKSISSSNNYGESLTTQNNIALALGKQKKFEDAKFIFKALLSNDSVKKDSILFSKVIDNYAHAKWTENPKADVLAEYLVALNIRKDKNDLYGQNASYAHLSDYYSAIEPDSAVNYANRMFRTATELHSPDDKLEALQKLIKVSPSNMTKHYFERYQTLDDSIKTAKNIAKNQFALIRYETEKSKADLLQVTADGIQKQADIFRKNILLAILVVAIIIGIFWYRKRRKGLQQEKELEVKNTELKFTKKVHDHVANKVYNVMSEVEYLTSLDRSTLLDKLDVIYKISRDISYDRKESYGSKFAKTLSEMLNSYSSAEVLIIGNEEELWYDVNETCKSEVFSVLQELMTNMKRHSGATLVSLDFIRHQSSIVIRYSDNGKGMKGNSPINGLKNTETRIQNIFGSITFEDGNDSGLNIQISFPHTK